MADLEFTITDAQAEIFTCKKRFRIVNAGRRFGKSYLSGFEMLQVALNKPDANIWYVAPTLPMGRDIMWNAWLKRNVPDAYLKRKNEQQMIMEFKNGSVIQIKTADNPDSLRGSGLDLLVIDEAAMIQANDFWETIRPTLSDRYHDGRCLIISTPKGYNWFYDIYQKAQHDEKWIPSWATFQFTTIQGGNVTKEELEEARASMTKKMFEQEYEASFETMSNRIYYAFDRNLNSCDAEDWFGKSGDIHVGIDFNVNPMTAAIFAQLTEKGRKISIEFDEIVEPNSDTQHLCDTIKEKYPHCQVFAYPDPTCRKHQTNATGGVTDMDILIRNGFEVRVPYSPYMSRDKFNCVNKNFCDAVGNRNVFIVKDKCPHSRKAMEGYVYKESAGTSMPDKSGGLDHISDAFAYYVNYSHPARASKIKRPQVLGV